MEYVKIQLTVINVIVCLVGKEQSKLFSFNIWAVTYHNVWSLSCEIPVNPCNPNPCFFGNCSVLSTQGIQSYQCICQSGWTGVNCATDIDECFIPNICNKNSYCVNYGGSYVCLCLLGFTGK